MVTRNLNIRFQRLDFFRHVITADEFKVESDKVKVIDYLKMILIHFAW